jgi:hypothetical protein
MTETNNNEIGNAITAQDFISVCGAFLFSGGKA